ncbi:hypothetical protein, partial [Bacteroides sp. 4_1_36]|uniref:hypothetical protein n=1 Tax=Bacteroides sp. 4_1_36 TaxID=457393 RepID=UPI001E61847A
GNTEENVEEKKYPSTSSNKRRMQYLCKAGQQVRAKAQDSAPDKDRMPLLGAPSLAGQASTGSANAAG